MVLSTRILIRTDCSSWTWPWLRRRPVDLKEKTKREREREKTLIFYKPLNNEFLIFLQLMMKVDKVSLLQNTKIAFFKDTVFKFKSSTMIL